MIKIIKHGTIKKHTCSECGCVFSYEPNDATVRYDFSQPMNYIRLSIKCPECETKIILDSMEEYDD